ncbi:MAG: phosphatase PAP2 family protein [Gammaproteobacteria bacterium]|nr:MAG: phosphatase PAP2 family protein [Gammaproteobacteria bacterium]
MASKTLGTVAAPWMQRIVQGELSTSLWFNRACYGPVQRFFATVSWLGDGKLWYGLMALLPLVQGWDGAETSLRMIAAGVVGLLVYKLIKQYTRRPRPCAAHPAIRAGTPPLDAYSLPSGHTLHAVSFTLILVAAEPALAPLLVPLTLSIAASRLVLGLHYPSDVLLGALIGAVLGLGFSA